MDAYDDAAIGRILHAQFLDGDIGAFNQIYERFQERIHRHVAYNVHQNPRLIFDELIAREAVALALSNYSLNPEKYDPDKSALLTYLSNAAYSDYVNEWRKDLRHKRHVVVIDEEDGNRLVDKRTSVAGQAELKESDAWVEGFLRSQCKTKDELTIARQIMDKERDANVCIRELGWPPGDDTVRRLYREKDKIMKRLRRNLPRREGDSPQ